MKIVCSGNMPFAGEAFSTLGQTVILPERTIGKDEVRDADILAIRSTTKITREVLEGSRVGFVGTATIGTDHMDLDYLDTKGVKWCAAPGCNANSVSEYLVSSLLRIARHHSLTLAGKTIGVVGVGNVGKLVAKKAKTLGMRILQNDPPRERAEGGRNFTGLDDLLAQSDIVTLHVPLTKQGGDATVNMANRSFFRQMKHGCIFVNAARGGLIDTDSLMQAMSTGKVAYAVIDTWNPEPAYRMDLLDRVDIGTPHIAGHSFEGKVMGTLMVYRSVCRFLGVKPEWTPDPLMPPASVPLVNVDVKGRPDEEVLLDIVKRVYDVGEDDLALRRCKSDDPAVRARHFDDLRRSYRERREFRFTTVELRNASKTLLKTVSDLGFSVPPPGDRR